MAKHRTRVGLHARNDVLFPNYDYALVNRAQIETLKMMSFTDIRVFARLKRENPNIEFIIRLYDDRLRHDSRPSPTAFVQKMTPVINRLKPYATKFEIHNEPNHVDGIEAWGSSDQHARSFRSWYSQVLPAFKKACPWAKFGFPGLALNHPHRDLEWLDICRDVILASDWLGCHCYWQYGNMMNDAWGLRFKLYHKRFPNMDIEITEFGDSTPNRPREQIAKQYALYYQELNKYPYLGSASAFIASSPDPTWVLFVWMKEGGEMLPVVNAVRNMKRVAVDTSTITPSTPSVPEPKPETPSPTEPTKRFFSKTGKTVRGEFLKFFNKYGMDICGYPITEQITENGKQVQYFQRVALYLTDKKEIRLKIIGTEIRQAQQEIATLEARIEELRKLPISSAGPIQPPMEDITGDLLVHSKHKYPTRKLTDINQVVIHHTATSPTITPQRLAEYHVRNLDKAGIVYHYVVIPDGTIYETNKLETVSDHAYARNQDSVGVCFTGNFSDAIPTTAQLQWGGQLCAWLLARLRLPTDRIVGAGEFVNTQSPGKQWLKGKRWKDLLLDRVTTAIEAGGEDQSVLIDSLRAQIEALKAEIDLLSASPSTPSIPGTSLLQEIADELSTLVASLEIQVKALKRENDKLIAELEDAPAAGTGNQAALIASLRNQIQALEQQLDSALSDLSAVQTALQAKDSEQATLITSLRNQIKALESQVKSLQQQIATLKEQTTAPPVVPGTPPGGVPGRVSQPALQGMIDKLPKHDTKTYGTRPKRDIKTFVIHHSAVAATVGPKRIAEYHVKNLDWPGIGYHFVVAADGILYQTNSVTTVSNHAAKVNPRGLGICFLGSFQKDSPPAAQLRAGAHLIAWLLQELDLDLDVVKGHQEFMQTACPGNQWLRGKKWKQMLRQEIANVQQGLTVGGAPDTMRSVDKLMHHYMLFWHHGDSWANRDWQSAQDYISTFQPTVGFSAKDAAKARFVTIVGGPLGVSKQVENWLVSQGCRIDRIAGQNEAATKAMLTNLVKKGKRFRSFDE